MSPPTPTLVNIGTHSLALYAHGPAPSTPDTPVVLFITGVATSSLVWAAVIQQLPASLRSYTYDRSGFSASDISPLAPTAENIALELALLLEKAPLTNPIVLVGHSWAGILIREFLLRDGCAARVAGLVLVDANQEDTPLVLNPNNANLQVMAEGIDWIAAVGLTAEHKFTSEEWSAFVVNEDSEKHVLQAAKEDAEYASSFDVLREKALEKRQPLLGEKPVYVIGGMRSRDWSGVLRAGTDRGNGSEEVRRKVRELIEGADAKSEGLMKGHLKLSTRGKVVFARQSGHFVQVTQPEMVVEGVKWVMQEMEGSQ